MSPEQFLKEFGHLTETVGGADQLRSLLLQLAIMGRLSGLESQRDTPKSNKVNAAPFELPREWRWLTTQEVGEVKLGRQRSPQNHTGPHMVPYLRVANVHENEIRIDDLLEMNFTPEEQETFRLAPDDILLNEGQSYELVGRPAMYRGEVPGACFQNTLLRFRVGPGLVPEYALIVFRCYLRNGRFRAHAKQTTNIAHLSAGRLKVIEFPLPPLPEQERIVEKVDQLMALCDELEAKQKQKREKAISFNQAALNAVVRASDKSALKSSWSRLQDHFEALYELPENVKELRRTILQLAVMGKLVRQRPSEGTGAELLNEIATKRSARLEAGLPNEAEAKTQLRKQEQQVLPKQVGALPGNWSWATLIQTGMLLVDCHNKTAPYTSDGIRLVRTTNVRDGALNLVDPKFVSEKTYERWSARCTPEPGDLLITREAPMGEVCIIPEGMKLCMGQRMMLLRLVPGTMDPRYVLYSIMSPDLMERVQDKPVGATVKHLRVGGVETLLVPVPPAGEQARIVREVDDLMTFCDELDNLLATQVDLGSKLMQAVVERLVA